MAQDLSLPPAEVKLRSSLLRLVITLLLTISLSLAWSGIDNDTPKEAGMLEPTRQALHRLAHASKPKSQASKRRPVTQVFTPAKQLERSGGSKVPGVILRSEATPVKPHRNVWGGPPLPSLYPSFSQPLIIPFTGEYHLFRMSSGQLPADSITEIGTPLETLYATTNREPLNTEAYQELDPPVNFSNCGKVQVDLSCGATLPGVVSLQFLSSRNVEDVGIALFALNGAAEETVNFAIPPLSHPDVRAIRVIFHHTTTECDRNPRVAIRRFTLVPKGAR
jgi:hypothetical protein